MSGYTPWGYIRLQGHQRTWHIVSDWTPAFTMTVCGRTYRHATDRTQQQKEQPTDLPVCKQCCNA